MSDIYDEIIIGDKKYDKKDLPKNARLILEELDECDKQVSATAIKQISLQGSISALKQALAQTIENWEKSKEAEESKSSE
jgi:hypothetical protein